MECARTEFEYFAPQLIQTSIERSFKREYAPVAALAHDSPIEFIIPGTDDLYLDLARSFLYIRARVRTSANANIVANNHVAPANLTIHSLFSSVEVELCGKTLSDANGLYPFRAMIETLLTYNNDAMESELQAAIWHKDTAGLMDATDTQVAAANRNEGLAKREQYFALSREADMIGHLHADVFHQARAIPDNCDLKIRLIPSKDKFVLKTAAPADGGAQENYQIQITEARFIVQTLQVDKPQVLALTQALEHANARFPLRRITMKNHAIPAGQTTYINDQLYNGLIPERIAFVMVSDNALNGGYQANPFNFQHFNVSFLALYINGQMVPAKPLQPDFVNQRYVREYESLFEGTCTQFSNHPVSISRSEFANGYTIWVFDLTPDQMCGLCTSAPRNGNVSVELKFNPQTAATVNLICYAEFESLFEIDKRRNVIAPFA